MTTPLTLTERTDAEGVDTATAVTDRMMLGTSPGKYGKHVPDALPLDTVTYLLRADAVRRRIGETTDGIVLTLDKRLDEVPAKDRKDSPAVARRTERMRRLVLAVCPQMRHVTQTELEADGLAESLAHHDEPEVWRHSPYPRYFHLQTAIVAHVLGVRGDQVPEGINLHKYGCTHSTRGDGVLDGGEVQYDGWLPTAYGIKAHYGPGGYDRDGTPVVPYQATSDGRRSRILIPDTRLGIETEIGKLQPGVSRIALDTASATAGVLLRELPLSALEDRRLASILLSSEQLAPVDDERELADVRAKLEAALTKLLEATRD